MIVVFTYCLDHDLPATWDLCSAMKGKVVFCQRLRGSKLSVISYINMFDMLFAFRILSVKMEWSVVHLSKSTRLPITVTM